jgi:hypothetical protein
LGAKETLQQHVASFEGVAQLCLLVGRTAGQVPPPGVALRFHQLCDNMGHCRQLAEEIVYASAVVLCFAGRGLSLLQIRHFV